MELTRIREAKESGLEINAKLSDLYLNVSATTLHIFMDVIQMIHKDGKQVCYDVMTSKWGCLDVENINNKYFCCSSVCDLEPDLDICDLDILDIKEVAESEKASLIYLSACS